MAIINQLKRAIRAYDKNGFGCGEQIDEIRKVPTQLNSIKAAVKAVSDNWSGGDLAEAVRNLVAEADAL